VGIVGYSYADHMRNPNKERIGIYLGYHKHKTQDTPTWELGSNEVKLDDVWDKRELGK